MLYHFQCHLSPRHKTLKVKRRVCVSLLSKDILVNLLGNVLSGKVLNREEAEGMNKEHVSSTDQASD